MLYVRWDSVYEFLCIIFSFLFRWLWLVEWFRCVVLNSLLWLVEVFCVRFDWFTSLCLNSNGFDLVNYVCVSFEFLCTVIGRYFCVFKLNSFDRWAALTGSLNSALSIVIGWQLDAVSLNPALSLVPVSSPQPITRRGGSGCCVTMVTV